jgi:hypothetical protein
MGRTTAHAATVKLLALGVVTLVAGMLGAALLGGCAESDPPPTDGGSAARPRPPEMAQVPAPPSRSALPVDAASAQALAGAPACDRYAGPNGVDRRRRGSRARPYRSVPRLLRALRAGQTGCLLPGSYRHWGAATIRRPRVTLRSLGSRRARIGDPIWIDRRAVGAQLLGLAMTSVDRELSTPLKVQADRVRIAGNVIYGSSNTTCVQIGSQYTTHGVRIEGNRIQNCGRFGKFDHLIYIESARRTVIRANLLTGNRGGWALHLYPDADDTLIEGNTIDRNFGGVIFAGTNGRTSDRNLVRHNAITNSGPRWSLEGSWSQEAPGVGNVAEGNCLFSLGPGSPSGIGAPIGFDATDNTVATQSPYERDYTIAADSPCQAVVGSGSWRG